MNRGTFGAVHTPGVDHHRLGRGQRLGMSKAGAGGFNRTARVMLFEMRWREPPPETGLRVTAWFVSITLHLLVAAAMLIYRPPAWVPPGGDGSEDGAIQVRLIERSSSAAQQAPPPIKLPPRVPRNGTRLRAPRRGAVSIPAVPRQRPSLEAPQLESTVAPPRVSAARPRAQMATVAPRAPQTEPASPRLAPPRIVPEASPMSVPPPTVKAPAVTAARPASADLAPVPVDRNTPHAEAPQLAVSAPRVERPSPTPVSPLADAPVPPPLAPVPLVSDRPAPALPQATPLAVPEVSASQVATTRPQVAVPEPPPLPDAGLSAPQAEAPQASPPAALPDAVKGALNVPPAPLAVAAPSPARAETPAPSSPATRPVRATASPTSAGSWADSSASDRFHGAQAASPKGGLKLYGKDGSLALTGGSGGGRTPDYIQRLPQGNSDVMSRRGSLIHYRATRFEQYWVPYGRSALDDALERLIDKLTVTKKFDLNSGIHGECKFSPLLFVAVIGCGANPPPTPLDTSNDKRLDMAPARPLVPGLGKPAPAPPASATLPHQDNVSCATARVAGSPPPPGCPGSGKADDQW